MTAGLVGIHAPSTQNGFLGIPFLALISSATASDAGSVSVAPIEVAEDGTVTCYACGQPDVNPKASFCDVTMSGHNCNLEATKIYNLSCSLMDNMQEPKLKKLWERWAAVHRGLVRYHFARAGVGAGKLYLTAPHTIHASHEFT